MGKSFALVTFFIVLVAVNQSDSLRCYACGEVNTFLGENYTNVLPCREFDETNGSEPKALERFAIECPSEYVGCITQKQGGQVMRTCDTFAIDDCQTANGVTYCYCNRDLCNGKLPQVQPHKEEIHHDLTDDEDYTEMSSGFGQNEGDHLKESSEDIGVQLQANATAVINGTSSTGETRGIDKTSSKLPHSSCSRLNNWFGIVLLLLVILLL